MEYQVGQTEKDTQGRVGFGRKKGRNEGKGRGKRETEERNKKRERIVHGERDTRPIKR